MPVNSNRQSSYASKNPKRNQRIHWMTGQQSRKQSPNRPLSLSNQADE